MKYSFKNVLVKAMFTLTVFDIYLIKGRSVLQSAQWITGSERVKSRHATLLKKRLWPWCFPVNFAKFLRTTFFTEHLWVTVFEKRNLINQESEKSFIVSLSFVSIS